MLSHVAIARRSASRTISHESKSLQSFSLPQQKRLYSSSTANSSTFEELKKKAKALFEPLMVGSKGLINDRKQLNEWKRNLGKNWESQLDRSQFQLLEKNRRDTRKVAPILILFWTPVIGYFIPLLCLKFPQLLPNSFLNSKQLKSQVDSLLDSRSKASKDLEGKLREEMKKENAKLVENFSLAKFGQASFLENAPQDQRHHLENFFSQDVSHLSEYSVQHLAEAVGLWKEWQPDFLIQQKLSNYVTYLSNDDSHLRKTVLSSLSEKELDDALFERGYSQLTGKSRSEKEEALKNWIEFTRARRSESLILHSIALRS